MTILEDSNTFFCSSKFPCARERISSKFMDSSDTHPQIVRQFWSVHFSPDVQDMSADFCFSGFSGSRLTERFASITVVNEVSPRKVRETVLYLASKERLGTTSRSAPFPVTFIGLAVPLFSLLLRLPLVPVSPTENILSALKFHFALHAYSAAPPSVSRIPVI